MNQDSTETLNQVKSKVKIGRLGLGIDKINKVRNGKVIIGCTDKKGSDKLAEELKQTLGGNYNIKTSEKKLPKVKILDVENEIIAYENTEIVDMLVRQNELVDSGAKLDVKKKIQGTKDDSGVLIVECDPKTHKLLLDNQRIKLGWNKCRVFDCVSVLRCYKCWGYFHFAKDCQSEVKCRKCAGNHMEKDCKSTHKSCVNCVKMVAEYKITGVKTDHSANDPQCEFYKRTLNSVQKNINYCAQ